MPDPDAPLLIADTSVLINLNATGRAAGILAALPFQVGMPDPVAAELGEDRRSGRNDATLVAELVAAGLLRPIRLGEAGQAVFASLVIGPAADTLDDGEAATIACAVERAACPVIDERKALRLCGRRFPAMRVLCTAELLLAEPVLRALEQTAAAEAVFRTLQAARMRVADDWVAPVVRLIGSDRAAVCSSLPGRVRGG